MYVIMGGSGHVGSALAETLLKRGEAVTIVTRDATHGSSAAGLGAETAVADVNDVESLRAAFRLGRRAFLLNPPAEITTDTDVVERETAAKIVAALAGSGLEKVVAESTAAAQPGERIGDSNTLWELEEGLRAQPIPAAINRAGYYMSNWDAQLEGIRKTGKLQTNFPADFEIPMVAPRDLGVIAAERLTSPIDDDGVRFIEGPKRYSSADVAKAFAAALGREVEVVVTPREQWVATYLKLGFSQPAAESYSRMTGLALDKGFHLVDSIHGPTTLERYIRDLVDRQPG
ncbi:NmrA family NAD(P)-binding protein [Sphingomonas sp. ERG5]|uniref:NmrA family NAD(P)-binding protein n=1 Tax=Sphingomonas sp. ERG5 TaxID=1381597 RepID=UPI00054C4D68|nr:NmrA family NAD(P)-binding protein [Sphingomonas sp. ERG5]